MHADGFSRGEVRLLRQLNTPEKIARFLDEKIAYNKEPGGPTCHSARTVLRQGVAHCIEGALLAAAALELQGRPPLIWDLEAVRDDDHVLALYRENECWGVLAKSNYSGIRHRAPVPDSTCRANAGDWSPAARRRARLLAGRRSRCHRSSRPPCRRPVNSQSPPRAR